MSVQDLANDLKELRADTTQILKTVTVTATELQHKPGEKQVREITKEEIANQSKVCQASRGKPFPWKMLIPTAVAIGAGAGAFFTSFGGG